MKMNIPLEMTDLKRVTLQVVNVRTGEIMAQFGYKEKELAIRAFEAMAKDGDHWAIVAIGVVADSTQTFTSACSS